MNPSELAPAAPAVVPRPRTVDELFRLHGARVAGWAAHLLGPGADVDDVVQEVFLVVQRRLPEFRGEARVTTWLYEITLRVTKSWRRRVRWRRWLGLERAADGDALISDRASPLQELETRQATQTVYAVLERLRERDRTVLVLFEIERIPGEQIAAIERTSLNNVWSRLHRARERFVRAYAALEREHAKKCGEKRAQTSAGTRAGAPASKVAR
jgi:RNA polymerase sigma-70 factor (ECF subfamily)